MRNLRSSALIGAMLPLGVLAAFVAMKGFGVDANVMALGGIAIAIGTMVDIGIVFVENIEQHLGRAPDDADRSDIVREAAPSASATSARSGAASRPCSGSASRPPRARRCP